METSGSQIISILLKIYIARYFGILSFLLHSEVKHTKLEKKTWIRYLIVPSVVLRIFVQRNCSGLFQIYNFPSAESFTTLSLHFCTRK